LYVSEYDFKKDYLHTLNICSINFRFPGNDQIPAEPIQAGGESLVSVIQELTNSIWNKEELPDEWKESNSTQDG
jgi:hypothetical protein